MASTEVGLLAEEIAQEWHESFVDVITVHHALLSKAFMDPSKLDQSSQLTWLELMYKAQSLSVGEAVSRFTDFYKSYRFLETNVRTGAPEIQVPQLKKNDLYSKLMITGPQQLLKKKLLSPSGFAPLAAITDTCNYIAATVQQMTMDAAKESTIAAYKADPLVTRVGRRAESGACRFCLMLVGRGAVYTEESARFESHRNCKCSPMPAFGGDYIANDEDKTELTRIMAEGEKWQKAHVYAQTKVSKAAKEDLVKAGLLKKTTVETPKYKTITDPSGSVRKVRDGVHVTNTFAKTQLARQGEAALQLARTSGYKKIMQPADRTVMARGMKKDTADKELNILRSLLRVHKVKGGDQLAHYKANSDFLFSDPGERDALIEAARKRDVEYKKNDTMADKHLAAFKQAKDEVERAIDLQANYRDTIRRAELAKKKIDNAERATKRAIDARVDDKIYQQAARRLQMQDLAVLPLSTWKERFPKRYPEEAIIEALDAMGIPYK